MISELIDKQDTFEIVRDQIAAILATEVASQMALAVSEGMDPELWNLNIYSERYNPWEIYLNQQVDRTPIVNVRYNDSSFDGRASDTVERQKTTAIYNIDCYALGVSQDETTGGHIPGDEDAALQLHRTLRLVRNILMAGRYTYLGMRGQVWQRWPQSIQVFDIELDNISAQRVMVGRIAFQVIFNELSPQVPFETLELVSNVVSRAETGQILIEADYQYPLTP